MTQASSPPNAQFQENLMQSLDLAWQRSLNINAQNKAAGSPQLPPRLPPPRLPPRLVTQHVPERQQQSIGPAAQSSNNPFRPPAPPTAPVTLSPNPFHPPAPPTAPVTLSPKPFHPPIQPTVPLTPLRDPVHLPTQTQQTTIPDRRSISSPISANVLKPVDSVVANDQPPLFIGVVGVTGSGKSSLINRVTGCDEVVVADGLQAGTQHVNQAPLWIGSTLVYLVDTPGFNDTSREDEDIYYLLMDWLKAFHEKGQKFSGLLYLHPINKTREKGSDMRSLRIFKRLVGKSNFDNIVIGLTFHDVEDPSVVASRERALCESPDFWADMLAAGASVTRIPSDRDECIAMIAQLAQKDTMTLQAEREMFEQNKSAAETSAMQEMPDHEELKAIRLKAEMEEAAQQMLFDERLRLTSQFSEERATLEQQLFEERQAKQVLEEEVLMWRNACEKEKENAKAVELQHGREEDLRKQKAVQKQREQEAREENDRIKQINEDFDRKEELAHAKRQITKIFAYWASKIAVLERYIVAANDSMKTQEVVNIPTSRGLYFNRGLRCCMCWSLLSTNDPFLVHRSIDKKVKFSLDVCVKKSCLAAADKYIDDSAFNAEWHYPLLTGLIECRRLREIDSLRCDRCARSDLSGGYMHCCECDDDNFDLCLECWAIKESGCRDKANHCLRLCYFSEKEAWYRIQPEGDE